jgi:hypothetical protein
VYSGGKILQDYAISRNLSPVPLPRISLGSTFRDFWETLNFYFFFLFLRLNSYAICRPYGLILAHVRKRNISQSCARFRQITPVPLRKMAKNGEKWRKIARDDVILQNFPTAVNIKEKKII